MQQQPDDREIKDNSKPPDAQPAQAAAPVFTRQKVRFRFILATPMLTTFLVLGLGFVIIYLIQQELITPKNARLVPADQLFNQISQTLNHVTIVIIIAAVLAFVAGMVMAFTITDPIKRLTMDAAIIARGDLTRKIRFKADGELALLGTAFNDMIASINEYMLQSMSGGLLTINEKGEITSMSGDAEIIIGMSADRVVGRPLTKIFPDIPENAKFIELIHNTLKQKRTFLTHKLEVSTEQRTAIPVSVSTYLLRDRDNILVGLVITFEDVARLRRIEEQMLKVDRLATLGGLAASIAHQVRNPLCSIRGLAQLLKENRPDDIALNDYSDIILKDVDRIDQVIKRLMGFLQPSNTNWTRENINNVLKDTLTLARHEIRGKNIELTEDYADNLPAISLQRENLIHAFLNLIVNAIQAIDTQGSIAVRTQSITAWDGVPGKGQEKITGVQVEIEDNGPGIPPEVIDKIFNPSYTTKENGSGFGLAITLQTIEAHGGEISVNSELGKRTTFTIWLPVRETATEEVHKLEPSGAA